MSSNIPELASTTPSSSALVVSNSCALLLDVLQGLHRGVRAPIMGEMCTIGSSPVCDLILADRGVAPDHLRLRFYGKQVAVDAAGGDVLVKGQPALRQGYGCRAKLPVTLTIGGATLRITRGGAGGSATKCWRPYVLGIGAILVVTPIVAVQAGIAALKPEMIFLANDPVTVGSVPSSPPAASDAAVMAVLRDRLAAAGLGALALSGDGRRIDVAGSVPPDRMEAWHEVQRWFDQSHGSRYVLSGRVSVTAAPASPKLVFQAVYFGHNPYVVDAKGERRYPGAVLRDGWTLKTIEAGQIVVVRGEQEFKLTL